MTLGDRESGTRLVRAAAVGRGLGPVLCALIVAVAATGCARSLVERAIAARGGPLESASRESEAEVYEKIPGTWAWRIDYRVPDRLRWTLETWGDEQTYAYDGQTVRYFLGTAPVGSDPALARAVRTQVRWIGLSLLDVLDDERLLVVEELPRDALPAGVASGLRATWREDGTSYLLYFDERDLLVASRGPVDVPVIGSGELVASYEDFREVGGFLLPFRGRYTLDGRPLFDETVLRWVPNDPALTEEAFTRAPPPKLR